MAAIAMVVVMMVVVVIVVQSVQAPVRACSE
ncbi:hypothetical protein HNP48_004331 [Acidovorax soli]|uniref:Uncharacterized protein n=1 Tax=Acidovorax soli TaxID=592050 RepID=A0A7X0PHH0_9BURK|nr:hypothetical protein [Acidovorax soli]